MLTLSRRSLITGLASLVAAPAIVRVGSIMPVKAWIEEPRAQLNWDFGGIDIRPGALNYAKPYPGFRFRFAHGIIFHEPDPDAALAT
jgi:hypothetical protein